MTEEPQLKTCTELFLLPRVPTASEQDAKATLTKYANRMHVLTECQSHLSCQF